MIRKCAFLTHFCNFRIDFTVLQGLEEQRQLDNECSSSPGLAVREADNHTGTTSVRRLCLTFSCTSENGNFRIQLMDRQWPSKAFVCLLLCVYDRHGSLTPAL